MSKALAIKELREFWWLGLLAAILISMLVCEVMGYWFDVRTMSVVRERNSWGWVTADQPFLAPGWNTMVMTICGGLGLLVGLWQTLSESVQGTWLFLLHRPFSRRNIMLTKLVAGLTLVGVSTAVPLLVYLAWAMTPGTHAQPFELWMTAETVFAWQMGPMIYLGAFLTGLRDARWYVSRLWPVGVILFLAFMARICFRP